MDQSLIKIIAIYVKNKAIHALESRFLFKKSPMYESIRSQVLRIYLIGWKQNPKKFTNRKFSKSP